MNKVDSIFWFRRDLRLHDNAGLFHALSENKSVLPVFIFDKKILDKLEFENDARVGFIHKQLIDIQIELRKTGRDMRVLYGEVEEVWQEILETYEPKTIHTNRDYEPYARARDERVQAIAEKAGCEFKTYKDQVMCEPGEVLKDDGKPYTVYTPYSKKMIKDFDVENTLNSFESQDLLDNFEKIDCPDIVNLSEMGFKKNTEIDIPSVNYTRDILASYGETRDIPSLKNGTTRLDPIVDAGMRELNETGYMHNRVRMITSAFLCKHLLIDWRQGERYFAQRLLDYEMASNVGNWQWASSSGADAAPYFRIFNPYTQQTKFDPKWEYISKWVPEYDTDAYVSEIVDYKEGRERALEVYKKALN